MSGHGPDIRLSDAERQEALDALSEHVRTGRLDVDEFGDRSARATAARKRSELEPLFADLPTPRPSFLDAELRAPEPATPALPAPPLRRRLAAIALPVAAIIAGVLFFTVAKVWFVFLIPVVVAMLAPSLAGGRGR